MKFINLALLVFLFSSCSTKQEEGTRNAKYFDIADYITKESKRLSLLKPTVVKTVAIKDQKETKEIKIENWDKELALFKAGDINKAAWLGAFKVEQYKDSVSYTNNNQNIPIKKVTITQKDKKVLSLKIYKHNQNYLYQSTDTLLYYPDSLYVISSFQKIKLMSSKTYNVKSILK